MTYRWEGITDDGHLACIAACRYLSRGLITTRYGSNALPLPKRLTDSCATGQDMAVIRRSTKVGSRVTARISCMVSQGHKGVTDVSTFGKAIRRSAGDGDAYSSRPLSSIITQMPLGTCCISLIASSPNSDSPSRTCL